MADEIDPTIEPGPSPTPSLFRARLWQLVLLVAFVAIAITDIRDHRRFEPTLLALAGAGFAAYALIAWLGWNFARRFEGRVGRTILIGLYLTTMAGLFLVATILYLLIEHAYLGGWW